jgi:hypothetical protein
MDKNQDNDPLHEKTEQIIEAILGPDEDFLDKENCEEFLLALGIDHTTLLSELKEHLEDRARQHQSERGVVPSSIVAALRVVRNRIHSSNPVSLDPSSHINLLLSGALSHQPTRPFARAFRRESDDELCAEDQSLLDELEAELGGDQEPGK